LAFAIHIYLFKLKTDRFDILIALTNYVLGELYTRTDRIE